MAEVSDEMLMRFADGELDAETSARLAAASAFTVRGPNDGGQSRKTNVYGSSSPASASAR